MLVYSLDDSQLSCCVYSKGMSSILVLKREQAKLAIAMVDKTFSGKFRGKKLPDEIIEQQKGLCESIKLLNTLQRLSPLAL